MMWFFGFVIIVLYLVVGWLFVLIIRTGGPTVTTKDRVQIMLMWPVMLVGDMIGSIRSRMRRKG